jgi:hypothetical protein
MPLLVRLRPNLAYLKVVLAFIVGIAGAAFGGGVFGIIVAVSGTLVLMLLGAPIVVSTVFRVPVVAIGADGIRFPLMGVRLGWAEIASVERGVTLRGKRQQPVLFITPTAPEFVIGQMRPWLRPEARREFARHGTPIVVGGQSLDHSLEDVLAAAHRSRPMSSIG